jgi:hypothetical protein
VAIEKILSQHLEANDLLYSRIMTRLRDNMDEMNIVFDVQKICPGKITFEVMLLICLILEDCDEIIQHFKRKLLGRELKNRSIRLAFQLRKIPSLNYLFESKKGEKVLASNFEILV